MVDYGNLDEIDAALPFTRVFQKVFLEKYWQKRPLLIRQAIPLFQSPVEPEELAGLVLDGEEVTARIILERDGKQPWEVKYGPFQEEDFLSLPKTHYTLLVPGLDRQVPAVSELLNLFPFIPRWRFDDVMASYSPEYGSVGPHSDSYDVFLLQANGRKTWEISDDARYDPDDPEAYEEGPMLRILKNWQPQAGRTLSPGDMLYLPPKVAHHGVALEKGLTYSVGFLAPKRLDLMLSYVDTISDDDDAQTRWEDPDLTLQAHHGEINVGALDKAEAALEALKQDRSHLAKWFGSHITAPKAGPDPKPLEYPMDWPEFVDTVAEVGEARFLESVRVAFVTNKTMGGAANISGLLFVNGQAAELISREAMEVAQILADTHRITMPQLEAAGVPQNSDTKAQKSDDDSEAARAEIRTLVLSLMNDGMLYFLGAEGADDEMYEDGDVEDEDEDEDGGRVEEVVF